MAKLQDLPPGLINALLSRLSILSLLQLRLADPIWRDYICANLRCLVSLIVQHADVNEGIHYDVNPSLNYDGHWILLRSDVSGLREYCQGHTIKEIRCIAWLREIYGTRGVDSSRSIEVLKSLERIQLLLYLFRESHRTRDTARVEMIVKLEQGDDHLTFMEKRKDQEEKLLRSLSIGSQCQEKLGLRSSFSRAAKAVFAGFVHTLATTGVVGIKSFLHRGNRNSASKGQRDRT